MNIKISDALRPYIDPLTAHEYDALERSILAEGCRDALVLWGEVLIDGHNRYAICKKHGIEFKTVQKDGFKTIEDVQLWMIDNHLARRSVSDFQRGMLALRKKEILAARASAQQDAAPRPETEGAAEAAPTAEADARREGMRETPAAALPEPPRLNTREDIARIAGISANTISRIEKIQKTAAPELVEAVRSGTISLNAAAAIASLPSEEQVAAVAGGRKELQQVARQVREAKSMPKAARAEAPAGAEPDAAADTAAAVPGAASADIASLTARIGELTAENAALKAQVATLTAQLEEARRAAA